MEINTRIGLEKLDNVLERNKILTHQNKRLMYEPLRVAFEQREIIKY